MFRKLLPLLFFGFLINPVFSQKSNTSKLDSLFQLLNKNDKFMGSLAIDENGQMIFQNTIGYADIETWKKLNHQTKFRIGSISKMFTASLIFKAIEEKKLSLNQTIDKYFPEIINANKITIRQLLSHRSGIHNFTDDTAYLHYHTTPKTEKELLTIIEKGRSDFEPGTKAKYSNSNYVLLTFTLEKLYKDSFPSILNKKIISPLGLQNTYVGGKINIDKNECYSYSYKDGWQIESETDMSVPQGAGDIVSNPADLMKFIESLFAGRIISSESLDSMKTVQDNIGLGIFAIPFYDKRGYGHNGGIDGFQSMLYYFPEEKVSICVLTNGTSYSVNDIAIAGLSWYFKEPFKLPSFKTITLTSEELEPYVGEYSSKDIPLKITITKENNTLIAQATGQSAFPLVATDKDTFEFSLAGIVLEFNPAEKKMILKQGGGQFNFTREE